jgi:hypothetical protein
MRTTALSFLALFMAGAAPNTPAPPKTHSQEEATLPPPDYIPPELREVLKRRMKHHKEDMGKLLFGVALLKREEAKAAAESIASEPRLARPLPGGEDELNALLPERFFTLQDELKRRATDVAEAAAHKNDTALAASFGKLAETCVACHSVYLKGKTAP